MFAVDVRRDTRGVVFVLRGDLDFHSAVQLYEAGDRELGTGGKTGAVVIDCSHLTYCDSTGITALLKLYNQLSEQSGSLRLAAVPAFLDRLFTLTGLDQIFSLHTDVDEALAAHAADRGALAVGSEEPARPSGENAG
ncbi:STAS domain-containing protein [Streptomyces sp. S1]|uniref:STAS domain-containing protein n=1 Tax=unclassified Streptomyces TaxID=2593676 RepID=UPI0023E45F94|nr:STAS domain-containing protein [Streptomyces sp. S1]